MNFYIWTMDPKTYDFETYRMTMVSIFYFSEVSIKYLFPFSFFPAYKSYTQNINYYSYIDLTLNAWSSAIYFKIFGCKAEIQIITICYYKNDSKCYRTQTQKVTEAKGFPTQD